MRTVTKWKLVPVEPTPEMMQAAWDKGNDLWNTPEGEDRLPMHQYAAMIAAAPDHPATAGDAEDAARYRMARKLPLVLMHDRVAPHRPEKFDAMIDRELRASKRGE